jgi:hypothetical protein
MPPVIWRSEVIAFAPRHPLITGQCRQAILSAGDDGMVVAPCFCRRLGSRTTTGFARPGGALRRWRFSWRWRSDLVVGRWGLSRLPLLIAATIPKEHLMPEE